MKLVVIVYPCAGCTALKHKPGHKWMVEEWHKRRDNWMKLRPVKLDDREFSTVDEIVERYSDVLDPLVRSDYDSATDSYSGMEDANFIVQGSHGKCSQCQEVQLNYG